MKVLLDMNLTPRWVVWLAQVGQEAVHWSPIGLACAPDTEIMAYAKANDFIVLTHEISTLHHTRSDTGR